MSLKSVLKRAVPKPLQWARLRFNEFIDLRRIPTRGCHINNLGRLSDLRLDQIFRAEAIDLEWPNVASEIEMFQITDKAAGVNPGDRRAIYYLLRHLRPASVLEIGTHLGASATHIVAALKRSPQDCGSVRFTSVDIVDVNDPEKGPWRAAGSIMCPADMIKRMGFGDNSEYFTQSAVDYMGQCQKTFDLIFLDGDHSAAAVYKEIPLALRLLNPGGYILLHDFFPRKKSLWKGGDYIPGPKLALDRLQKEGAKIDVYSFGELPWATKLGSKVTSLAILGRAV
jgi:predicted O-methyltransferase YrrM